MAKKPISIQSRRKQKKARPDPVVTVQWAYDPQPHPADIAAWHELWDTLYALCYPLSADEHAA